MEPPPPPPPPGGKDEGAYGTPGYGEGYPPPSYPPEGYGYAPGFSGYAGNPYQRQPPGYPGYGGYDYPGYPQGPSYGPDRRDFDRRDEPRALEYGKGGGREAGKGFDAGFGRGMPLPEPVEVLMKGLPMDASEPALRSLFHQKGLSFDSVEFQVTAALKVSGQATADQVIQAFHMYQIAGKALEVFRQD
ncbi:unnamed protein product, partial [Effrenium voratum]